MRDWTSDLKVVVPAPGLSVEIERASNASSSTDLELSAITGDLDQRTHHLLKHCLSTNQRDGALEHFSVHEVKEAAKDISRMGQRDLQAKFKLVYGTNTHSNNNDWLRRKLYEAIGASPIKAATKGKARKPSGKPRKASPGDSPSSPCSALSDSRKRPARSLEALADRKRLASASSVSPGGLSMHASCEVLSAASDPHILTSAAPYTAFGDSDAAYTGETETPRSSAVVSYRPVAGAPAYRCQPGHALAMVRLGASRSLHASPVAAQRHGPAGAEGPAPPRRTASLNQLVGLSSFHDCTLHESHEWMGEAWQDLGSSTSLLVDPAGEGTLLDSSSIHSGADDDIMMLQLDLPLLD